MPFPHPKKQKKGGTISRTAIILKKVLQET